MTYIIAEPCVDLKDSACVDVCPVDCIYTTDEDNQYYIHPDECIDCAACEPVCPVVAIFAEDDVPKSGATTSTSTTTTSTCRANPAPANEQRHRPPKSGMALFQRRRRKRILPKLCMDARDAPLTALIRVVGGGSCACRIRRLYALFRALPSVYPMRDFAYDNARSIALLFPAH